MKTPLLITALVAIVIFIFAGIPLFFSVFSDTNTSGRYDKAIPENEIQKTLTELKSRAALPDLPDTAKDIEILTAGSIAHASSVLVSFRIDEDKFRTWTDLLPATYVHTTRPPGFLRFPHSEEDRSRNHFGYDLDTGRIQITFD